MIFASASPPLFPFVDKRMTESGRVAQLMLPPTEPGRWSAGCSVACVSTVRIVGAVGSKGRGNLGPTCMTTTGNPKL